MNISDYLTGVYLADIKLRVYHRVKSVLDRENRISAKSILEPLSPKGFVSLFNGMQIFIYN